MLNEAAPQWAGSGLRVVAPNAPGFGESPPADDYSVRAMAARAVGVLDELGLERVSFAGYSWGARVGLRLPPERVDALVLLDAGYVPSSDFGTADEVRERFAADWPSWSGWEEFFTEAREHVTASPATEARLRAALVEREGKIVPRLDPEIAVAAFARIREEPDAEWWSRWRETPILLLTQAEPEEDALAAFLAALPQAEVQRVPNAGHDVLGDNPNVVVPLVSAFLRRSAS